jgi:hypothetical protein
MKNQVTYQEAEKIRESLGLDVYQFSSRIGLSPTAYLQAKRREKIGPYMSFRIMMHCQRQLADVRG